MPQSADSRPSIGYWLISLFLLAWGSLGLLVYVFYFIQTPEEYAHGVEDAAHHASYAAYVAAIPAWAIAAGVAAALARFIAAVGLMMRRACAAPLFAASLVIFLVALFRAFVLGGAGEAMSTRHIVIEIIFVALSLFAVWFAYTNKKRGVLR